MRLELTFGPLSIPLLDQLQGICIDPQAVKRWQRAADALELTYLEKLISDSVVREGRKRLMRGITKELNGR